MSKPHLVGRPILGTIFTKPAEGPPGNAFTEKIPKIHDPGFCHDPRFCTTPRFVLGHDSPILGDGLEVPQLVLGHFGPSCAHLDPILNQVDAQLSLLWPIYSHFDDYKGNGNPNLAKKGTFWDPFQGKFGHRGPHGHPVGAPAGQHVGAPH